MITGWLVKFVVGLALAAVVLFDGGSILVNFFTLDGTANDIANEISTEVQSGQTLIDDQLRLRAEELAKEADATLLDLQIEGDKVQVKLRRRAGTLVVGKIGWIKHWARATATAERGRASI